MIAAMVVVLALAIAWGVIADARADSARLERRQSTFDDYTGRVRSLLQSVRPAAEGMAQVPATPGKDDLGALGERAQGWTESLEIARLQTQGAVDPPSAVDANGLYDQALAISSSAARTYELVPEAEGRLRDRLLERAAEQRDAGAAVWLSATQVLDSARARAGLGPSGIGPLANPALSGAAATLPGVAPGAPPGGGASPGSGATNNNTRRDEGPTRGGSTDDGGR
jgi:hypothetical protein